MNVIAKPDIREATNSATGNRFRDALDTAPVPLVINTALPGPATANTYVWGSMTKWSAIVPCAERTATGPTGQIDLINMQSIAGAGMESRRRSGLTWEDLGDEEDTRAQPLTVGDDTNVPTFHLSRGGPSSEAAQRAEGDPELEHRYVPLSGTADDTPLPQPPVLLLEAEQDRPDIPANARIVRPKRISKRAG